MRSGRLFEILLLLANKRKTTAGELAQKFEVSVRTIYRDFEKLSLAGVPIYTKNGKNGGVYLMEDYILDRSIVSNDEKDDILMALKAIGSLPNMNESDILKKVAAVFNKNPDTTNNEWLEVDLSPWKSVTRKETEIFKSIKESIIQKKCLKLNYVSTRLEESSRTIDPLKLIFKDRDWYLIAYCKDKNGFRMFKLKRIISCEVLSEEGSKYENIPRMYDNDYIDGESLQRVEILFSMRNGYRVFDDFNPEQISKIDDGKILLSGDVEINDWFISKLLSYGGDIDIKAPIQLRKIIIECHKDAIIKLKDE